MFVIPDSFPWLPPWKKISADYIVFLWDDLLFSTNDVERAVETPFTILNKELHREMPEGHVLYGLGTEVVAVCTMTHKDFVFVTDDAAKPFAIVHLTWSDETDPKWPATQVFTSLDELEAELRRWADQDFWHWPDNST